WLLGNVFFISSKIHFPSTLITGSDFSRRSVFVCSGVIFSCLACLSTAYNCWIMSRAFSALDRSLSKARSNSLLACAQQARWTTFLLRAYFPYTAYPSVCRYPRKLPSTGNGALLPRVGL